MKDINIVIDSQTHKVQFPDNFLGLNAENLQGNINFTFTNGFVNGIARLELSIDCESGFIPNLQNTGDSYTLPILSSLLTSDNIVMQLVIEQTDLITYKLTTDTSINNQKTYYTRSGVEGEYVYTIVENPKVADIGTYYEAQIPIFKTHIFNMTVGESINAVNTIPDDYPTWIDTLNSLVGQVNAKIIEMNQALAEVDNLDITATKEGTTVTITITRKDGSQQVVTITDGKDGVGIEKIEKTGTNLLVDTYTIYYTDDSTSTFQVKNGRGIVSIDKTDTNILTDTYTITYNDDTTSTFYVVNGNGVESIEKTGTSGLIDTYRISYTNGEYYDYQVANGNGIDNIQKTDTTGLVDTYTITYTNGTTSTYIITNGNGISNIAKTSTVDNVDTYTIYYTNGTTSTFTVTNSTVTNQEFQELQRLVDYNALYANALIKMNNSGADLTINDTAEAPMPMTLSPSELEQETTTGKNSIPTTLDIIKSLNTAGSWNNNIYTYNGITFTINDDLSVLVNGTASGTSTLIITNDLKLTNGVEYILNGCPTGGGVTGYSLRIYKANIYQSDVGNGYTFTYDDENLVRINVSGNTQVNNLIFKPMIRLSSISDDTYEKPTFGASPNPQYPQDIHTISGDNEIKVENVNLWNEKWEIGGYNTTTGIKDTSQDKIRNKYPISCEPSTQYYICINNNESSNAIRLLYYDRNMNFISTVAGNRNTIITTPANTYYMNIMCTVAYGTTYKNDICINVSNSSINGNYYPHQEQSLPLNLGDLEYCKIGNYEDEFVIPSGKNLFKPFSFSKTSSNVLFTYNIDGTITASGTASANASSISQTEAVSGNYYTTLQAGTYTLTGGINSNKAIILINADTNSQIASSTGSAVSFTLNSETKAFIRCYINSGTQTNDTFYVMLNTGTTALPYEPYNNGKWYLKKNIGKVVLDGSENWSLTTATHDDFTRFGVSAPAIKGQNLAICNYFVVNDTTSTSTTNLLEYRNTNYIYINTNVASTAADLQTWLSTHNTEVDYVLETPEYIPLNDTLQSQLTEIYKWVKAYQEQTNISQVNNDLPFVIKASAVYDLNKLLTRVEVLESEV